MTMLTWFKTTRPDYLIWNSFSTSTLKQCYLSKTDGWNFFSFHTMSVFYIRQAEEMGADKFLSSREWNNQKKMKEMDTILVS